MNIEDAEKSHSSSTNRIAGDEQWLRRQRRFCMLWALAVLPPFLGVVSLIGSATHLRFLLFPPLAAIGYALFGNPYNRRNVVRSAVLGPITGALLGVAAVTWFPAGPLRVMLVTALGIVALYALSAELTPALAVALLTLLVGAEGAAYILSIAISSFALCVIFLVWRRVIYDRVYPPAPDPGTPFSWRRLKRLW